MDEDTLVNTGGIEVHLTSDGDVLTKLAGVKTVTAPHLRIDEVETSDQDSAGTKDFNPGMGEWPDITVTLKYVPGSDTDLLIQEHLASREKRAFKIVVVEGDGTTQDESGVIFLKSYEPDNGQLNNERIATVIGRPGPITRAPSVA